MEKYAIIDLGSNTVRLVIYEIYQNGSFKLVEDLSNTVRLSKNMIDNKYLNEKNMEKALFTIRIFSEYCKDYNIKNENIIAVATEAVRKAENGTEFLNRLKNISGITFRILTGDEEALYVYKAVIKSFKFNKGIIVDIGGGSTEIIKFKENEIIGYISLPFGCVLVSEKYFDFKNPISESKLQKLESDLLEKLKTLSWVDSYDNPRIIGLGGTIRNLSNIHRYMTNYPFRNTHNYQIDKDSYLKLFKKLKKMSLDEIQKIKGLTEDRADVIVGGLSIFTTLVNHFNSKQIVISGYGLREGVFLEFALENTNIISYTDPLSFSIENLILLYKIRKGHAMQVNKLSKSLFDKLKPLHKLDDNCRKYIHIASMLHDIGIFISYYSHNLNTLYLILNSNLNGLSHSEILMVAIIASGMKISEVTEYLSTNYIKLLSKKNIQTIKMLSLILKIAEDLDKSETNKVSNIDIKITKNNVKLKTLSDKKAEIEIHSAKNYCDRFAKIFEKTLIIE